MSNKPQRKVAVLFSHNTHSFIISEIRYAASVFDQVVVLCPDDNEIHSEAQMYNNVVFHSVTNLKSFKTLMKGMKNVGRFLKQEFGDVRKKYNFSKHYFKILGQYVAYTTVLGDEIQELLQVYNADEIVIVSLWFSATSFATSLIKERYPDIQAVSLAHSFEVDDDKNSYVDCFFKSFCHDKLDYIFFISEMVRDRYILKHAAPNFWDTKKISVTYLGVTKKRDGISKPTSNHPYRIVSCSHCVPVKRIDLIASSVKLITNLDIEWVHIGDGPTLKTIEKSNEWTENVKFITLGKKTNDFVHDYLCHTEIDVFINLSSSEGLPVTLMEAIAYGIPIIATDVGGTSEIFKENIGYLLSSNPSPEEVSEIIEKTLSDDLQNKITLRKNAYRCYCNNFDADILRRDFYRMISESNFGSVNYVSSD